MMNTKPRKTKRMLRLEEKLGVPLEEALTKAYNEAGSIRGTAERLNQRYSHKLNGMKFKDGLVYYYMMRLGLTINKKLE